MTKKKVKSFQIDWCLKYGIAVSSRCSQTGLPISAKCLFCARFGKDVDHEAESTRKRKRTCNVQYFKQPWRTDNIQKHMKEQHNVKFIEYLESSVEMKKQFFASTDTTFQPLNASHEGLNMLIDKKIVEKIIAELLLDTDSDDENLNSNVMALKIFQLQEEDESNDEVNSNSERYLVSVANSLQFKLIVQYIRAGLSFRQCCAVFLETKETTNLGQLGNINLSKVIAYSRFVCAMAYQMIADVLRSVWAYSIAMDGGNKSSVSYLDVRIRFCVKEVVHNIHVVALPMRERHTGLYMFNLISEFFNALSDCWKSKLIGISSDGTSSMTGRHAGVVTRLHQVTLPGCYRVWCAAHQMDLVIQKTIVKLCDDSFINTVMAITGHLRRQQNLIVEMQSKCPRFIDTRWLSMQKLLKWLVLKRPRLQRHFEEKKPSCAPKNHFWIIVYVLKSFVDLVNACLVAIQGLSTLMSEQKERLNKLVAELIEDGGVDGPNVFEQGDDSVVSGPYRVTYENAEKFIKDQDSFVVALLQNLKENDHAEYIMVVRSTAILFANGVNGLSRIVVERDTANEPIDNIPPVLSNDLVKLRPFDFSQLVLLQNERLKVSMTDEDIIQINDQFKMLKDAYRREVDLKDILDQFNYKTTFQNGWKILDSRFPLLCQFVGGLASVFPGTSTVESNFSVIGWEKNEYRTSLTNFSLEGILHCKQYDHLKGLSLSFER